MSCLTKVNCNTAELTVHNSCYCVLDLLCLIQLAEPNKSKANMCLFTCNRLTGKLKLFICRSKKLDSFG